MLNREEKERYSRQLLLEEIGKAGQEKIKKAKVLVVGAGGLGSPVLQYLAAAGVGELGILDGDKVSLSNLPRQILYADSDIGEFKALAAVKRLGANNPHCSLKAYTLFLNDENAQDLISNYDILVDCTDNFATRYLIDRIALKEAKTWVYGSVLQYTGQVAVFHGGKGQSYKALFAEEDNNHAVASEFGVLGVLTGIIGCLQASEVIKIICDTKENLSGSLLTYDLKNYRQQLFNL